MEHIRITGDEELFTNSIWDFYFQDRSVGVLDIETTGLDRIRNHFILGGLYDVKNRILHQVFAENTAEEAAALAEFMDEVCRFDTVITYNGRRFDMPFLEERITRCGGTFPETESVVPFCGYDLDLYQVVNGYSPIRRLLPNLRQKTLETYMGLWTGRDDEISGAESVELYLNYARTKDPSARQKILLHNSDDVLQLTRLVKVITKCDFHKAMFHLGFPAGTPEAGWQVRKIRLEKDQVCVQGSQGPEGIDYRGFSFGDAFVQMDFDKAKKSFVLCFPLVRRGGIAAVDLQAMQLPLKKFKKYPGYGSGFLVVQERDAVKYTGVNHFVLEFIKTFERSLRQPPLNGE